MTFSITNATARLPWFDENFLSNFKLCLDLTNPTTIFEFFFLRHCTAQPHGMYLRLWFWFNFCHFNFSWALFSFHCVFSLFTSFELYGGKFVEYQLFVYFLHFNLCIPFYWYLYCFKKSIQSSIVFMEFLWEYLWYIHQVTG